MNKENLLKLRELATNIPQEKFDMGIWRMGEESSHICNSVGCLVGHSTILDPLFVEDNDYFRLSISRDINFADWSESFFETTDKEWKFLFGPQWEINDNTIEGAIKRIDYVLAGNNVEDFKFEDFKEGWEI